MPTVNVVFYVSGSVAKFDVRQIEASRFSRRQKMLLVAVPVPQNIKDAGRAVDFVIDALHKANAIAAEVFAHKGTEPFDLERANAIVSQVGIALSAMQQ